MIFLKFWKLYKVFQDSKSFSRILQTPEGPGGPRGLELPEGGIKGTVPGGTKVEAGGCTVEGCVRGCEFETTGTEGPAIGAPIGMGGGLKIAVGVLSTIRILGKLGINLKHRNFARFKA